MTNPCQGHAAESARAEKPEALRLADWLESEDMPTEEASCAEAAAELRRPARGGEAVSPQDKLMEFDPATGDRRPYPSHAGQWRLYHGQRTAWLFNPWTGQRRDARDVGSDVQGLLIHPVSPEGSLVNFAGGNRASGEVKP